MRGRVAVVDEKIFQNEREVTASIVTYNNESEIDELMLSLQGYALSDEITVYVIDNASNDNTVSILKERYPWARLIENKKNLGFGKGHNIAIHNVKSRYHIIINPDISFSVGTIEKLKDYMERNHKVVLIAPLFLNDDNTQQFLPKKNPSIKYLIGGLFEKQFKFCRELRNEYTLKNQIITTPIDVEFCSGAFMFTRTDALQKVGGFDERYFLHFEDADLTRELCKIGRVIYNPNIQVVHKWHRDNKKIGRSFISALHSMILYMKKWN